MSLNSDSDTFGGRVAWLVGATGTLGEATARLLAERGARLVLSARDPVRLAALARSIDSSNRSLVCPVDLTSNDDVLRAATTITAKVDAIDFLAISVSVSAFGEFLDLPDDAFQSAMETKYLGSIRAIRAVLPAMIARGFGRIVVLSGRGGTHPRPVHLPGCGANAALELLVRGLAKRYAGNGIRVNAVAPGPIESPRTRAILGASRVAGHVDIAVSLGLPKNVAEAICYLLSDRSAFVSGDVLRVDGGVA